MITVQKYIWYIIWISEKTGSLSLTTSDTDKWQLFDKFWHGHLIISTLNWKYKLSNYFLSTGDLIMLCNNVSYEGFNKILISLRAKKKKNIFHKGSK